MNDEIISVWFKDLLNEYQTKDLNLFIIDMTSEWVFEMFEKQSWYSRDCSLLDCNNYEFTT